MQQEFSLSGQWQFQLDPRGELSSQNLSPDREITVPLPWQAVFPELARYSGYAWYLKEFEVEKAWLAGDLLLKFGAVDYWCQVFVNGQLAAEHEGGYTPFSFSLKELAKAGKNQLAVRVYDSVQTETVMPRWLDYPKDTGNGGPPFSPELVPHGKQEWYVNVGGIWQDVTLQVVPACYIEQVHVTPDIHSGQVRIQIEVGGNPSKEYRLEVKLAGQHQAQAFQIIEVIEDQTRYATSFVVENFRLWSPETPHLYQIETSLKSESDEHNVKTRFGFREIRTENGQLLLNDQPLFLLAVLDQDLYPGTIYTVPSEEFLRDQFRKTKELGFNCLRCHIKPPDPLYLELADEMGLLVWEEIPSWRTFLQNSDVHSKQVDLSESVRQRVKITLEEMVRRDYNHPSIIIWTIVNEDWGTSLPFSSSDRAWVAQMYDYCKALDPTRLVVDNSACVHLWGPNLHVKSDLDDFHFYANIPDLLDSFDHTLDMFNLRSTWSYSSYGDAQRTGQEPLILSEFGNWGLPSLRGLKTADGSDPDWFSLGPWWSGWEGEPGWPAGVEERFKAYGLDTIWPDYEAFARCSQWHEYAALKFEIECIRRQPNLRGYVITELADTYWESNGLLDWMRKPKEFFDQFKQINAADMLIPRIHHYDHWADQNPQVLVYASHYSQQDLTNSAISMQENQETLELGEIKQGQVKPVSIQTLALPEVEKTRQVDFPITLIGEAGQKLAQNKLELLVLPAGHRVPHYTEPLAVFAISQSGIPNFEAEFAAPGPMTPDIASAPGGNADQANFVGQPINPTVRLIDSLERIGYKTQTSLSSDTKVAVSNYPTAPLLEWVAAGGNLLYIASGPSPFYWVRSRGGVYSGSWITSFSWLRPEVCPRLEVVNPLGLPYKSVMPLYTILGLPVSDARYHQDFLAGSISGWLHHPAIHTVQFRYGKGKVLMTTFSLEKALPNDPVAVAMTNDYIEWLVSEKCQPYLETNYQVIPG